MKFNSTKLFILSQILLLILFFSTSNVTFVVCAENIVLGVLIVHKIGKGIVLREIIGLHASIVLLLMPLIGYTYYTNNNPISRIWVKFMPIPQDEYYAFVLPAVLFFNLILCWPIRDNRSADQGQHFFNRFDKTILHLEGGKVVKI